MGRSCEAGPQPATVQNVGLLECSLAARADAAEYPDPVTGCVRAKDATQHPARRVYVTLRLSPRAHPERPIRRTKRLHTLAKMAYAQWSKGLLLSPFLTWSPSCLQSGRTDEWLRVAGVRTFDWKWSVSNPGRFQARFPGRQTHRRPIRTQHRRRRQFPPLTRPPHIRIPALPTRLLAIRRVDRVNLRAAKICRPRREIRRDRQPASRPMGTSLPQRRSSRRHRLLPHPPR